MILIIQSLIKVNNNELASSFGPRGWKSVGERGTCDTWLVVVDFSASSVSETWKHVGVSTQKNVQPELARCCAQRILNLLM